MTFNKNIHILQHNLYDVIMYVTYLLYILIVFGLSASAPQYLESLNRVFKIYISLFLIYRFNPFRRVKFTGLDAKISFSAGVFLLGTTAVDGILKNYLLNIKKYIK